MNIAVIFAGGVGVRMNSKSIPKQFLEVYGKPIIIYTLELFDNNIEIDGIVIACHKEWIDYLKKLIYKYRIKKILDITEGGTTGQLSIYNGLKSAKKYCNSIETIVLIHDGVRPLINNKVIHDNIESVKKYGTAITTSNATETFAIIDKNNNILEIKDRNISKIAKAPQSFWLNDILEVHENALIDGITNSIDSCTLMYNYGKSLNAVEGPYTNIKVTTQEDYYMFRSIQEAKENLQLNIN